MSSGVDILHSGPPSGNSHSYTSARNGEAHHDREIRRRTDDLLIVEGIEIKIAQVSPTNHAQSEFELVTRQQRKLRGHSAGGVVFPDANRTATASSREGEVFGITLDVVLISGRRGNSETLIYLLRYPSEASCQLYAASQGNKRV